MLQVERTQWFVGNVVFEEVYSYSSVCSKSSFSFEVNLSKQAKNTSDVIMLLKITIIIALLYILCMLYILIMVLTFKPCL